MDYYKNLSDSVEIDLRKELDNTLLGAADEITKGITGLLRRVRRDSTGEKVRCVCRDETTDEPSKDTNCPYCWGLGFLWDEHKVVYYKYTDSFRSKEAKAERFERSTFYIKYTEEIDQYDYLVELRLDVSGNVVNPVARERLFNIIGATPYRSDNGRIEYWMIDAIEERKWSVHYGLKLREPGTHP
jgi:hypothetical protein